MSEQPSILVVDDEEVNRFVLEAILLPEGYEIIHASDGGQALERISRGGIDLVLLDILMPQPDGIETCRRIREDLLLPLLPVIIVTALDDRGSRIRCKSCGADDYLVKPIYDEELLARVRTLLMRNAYYEAAERERARAEAETKRWKLVSEVASVVAVCTDYDALQLAIRDALLPHLPIHSFVVLEMSGDQSRLLPPPTSSVPPTPPISAARFRSMWDERNVTALEPFASELAPAIETFPGRHAKHGALMPLRASASVQGVLAILTTRPLDPSELQLVDELAPHLTNAVMNVRSHVKAKQLNEARDRLSLLLVHDLKNPLSVISMNLEMLAMTRTKSEEAEALRDARTASERMLQMILDLLDVGSAEEGRLLLQREPTTMESIVQTVLAHRTTSAALRRVRLSSTLAPGVVVDVDTKLITRVLENLIGNALRYVPVGGHIDVRSQLDGPMLAVQVSNDGPAISPEVRGRLFEKYGSDSAHHGGPNRGLGLYFCRLVLEAHGGTIEVTNLAAGGVCFELRLPTARDAISAPT